MKHLSYDFPSEAGQRWDVRPISFRTFFKECSCITIPLFQRKYCWTEDQIKVWFYDLTTKTPRFTSGRGHSVGKIMFKRNILACSDESLESSAKHKEELICIDGQQRITTTLLSLASLRDCAIDYLLSLSAAAGPSDPFSASSSSSSSSSSLPSTSTSSSSNSNNDLNRLTSLVADIDSILFSDISQLVQWEQKVISNLLCEAVTAPVAETEVETTVTVATLAKELPIGATIPFSRLHPSYLDRTPFLELLLVNKIRYLLSNEQQQKPVSQSASQSASQRTGQQVARSRSTKVELVVQESSKYSVQFRVKSQFDNLIKNDVFTNPLKTISSKSSQEGNSQSKIIIDRFYQLFNKILDHFQFVFMEYLNDDIYLPQLFLWLQEKSIFSMGALLWNPAPGIKFRAIDLVRNLLMSEIVNMKQLQVAEQVYRESWIIPIEQYFVRGYRPRGSMCVGAVGSSESSAGLGSLTASASASVSGSVSASGSASGVWVSSSEAMDAFLEAFAYYVSCCSYYLKNRQSNGVSAKEESDLDLECVVEVPESPLAAVEQLPTPPSSTSTSTSTPFHLPHPPHYPSHHHQPRHGLGHDPLSSTGLPQQQQQRISEWVELHIDAISPHLQLYYSDQPSTFEQTLTDIVTKFGKAFNPQENKGVFLYAKIYSLYEHIRVHFEANRVGTSQIATANENESTECDVIKSRSEDCVEYPSTFAFDSSKSSGYLAAQLLLADMAIFREQIYCQFA